MFKILSLFLIIVSLLISTDIHAASSALNNHKQKPNFYIPPSTTIDQFRSIIRSYADTNELTYEDPLIISLHSKQPLIKAVIEAFEKFGLKKSAEITKFWEQLVFLSHDEKNNVLRWYNLQDTSGELLYGVEDSDSISSIPNPVQLPNINVSQKNTIDLPLMTSAPVSLHTPENHLEISNTPDHSELEKKLARDIEKVREARAIADRLGPKIDSFIAAMPGILDNLGKLRWAQSGGWFGLKEKGADWKLKSEVPSMLKKLSDQIEKEVVCPNAINEDLVDEQQKQSVLDLIATLRDSQTSNNFINALKSFAKGTEEDDKSSSPLIVRVNEMYQSLKDQDGKLVGLDMIRNMLKGLVSEAKAINDLDAKKKLTFVENSHTKYLQLSKKLLDDILSNVESLEVGSRRSAFTLKIRDSLIDYVEKRADLTPEQKKKWIIEINENMIHLSIEKQSDHDYKIGFKPKVDGLLLSLNATIHQDPIRKDWEGFINFDYDHIRTEEAIFKGNVKVSKHPNNVYLFDIQSEMYLKNDPLGESSPNKILISGKVDNDQWTLSKYVLSRLNKEGKLLFIGKDEAIKLDDLLTLKRYFDKTGISLAGVFH